MNNPAIRAAIQKSINYLTKLQRADGSFVTSRSSMSGAPVPLVIELNAHALILDILHTANNPGLQEVSDKLHGYLTRRIDALTEQAALNKIDTYSLFHCLTVLYEHSPQSITPATIAAAIRLLVDFEHTPGGPYRNVLDLPADVPDIETNIRISHFLHRIGGGPFPKLTAYISENTLDDSRYYTEMWPLNLQLLSAITSHESIIDSQLLDGSWPVTCALRDPHETSLQLYESAALATATMLTKLSSATPKANGSDTAKPEEYNAITKLAEQDTRTLDPLIAPTMRLRIERLIRTDVNLEIGLLALRFVQDLRSNPNIAPETVTTLGLANVYNWVAYTIYDDFLDDEGDPSLLSTANIALRNAYTLFAQVVRDSAFTDLVHETFNTIDAANMWEVQNCRFTVHGSQIHIGNMPDYEDLHSLCNRSLSHGLPIIGALVATGLAVNDPATKCVRQAFKHYLIIRQLSDDLHDWQEDLRAGHISYVVAQLLTDAAITPGVWPLDSLTTHLGKTFWDQSLYKLHELMHEHAAAALTLLSESKLVRKQNALAERIHHIEDITTRILAEQAEASEFMQAFRA